jgi:hypothetical protein
MHDDTLETPESPAPAPKGQPSLQLTEAELSRIAREAVHQAPDARLDKQLVRMGLMDAAESAAPVAGQAPTKPIAVDPELGRLREELRRARLILWGLVGVIVILAIAVVVLLVR